MPILLLIFLFACQQPHMQRAADVIKPESFTAQPPLIMGEAGDDPWWYGIGDDQVVKWIDRATETNPGIQHSIARLQELGALYAIAEGRSTPTIQFTGLAQRFMQSQAAPIEQTFNVGVNRFFEDYTFGFVANWELDLWGRLDAVRKAALADFEAAKAALMLQAVTIPAEIAISVNTWRQSEHRSNIIAQRFELLHRRVELHKAAQEAGLLDEPALNFIEQSLANLRIQQLETERLKQESIRRLSMLMGEYPHDLIAEGVALDKLLQHPVFPVAIPSEILMARPDVRQAYAELEATEARVAEAVANRYPVISLEGTLGLNSKSLKQLFTAIAGFASIGPTIAQTVLDAGRLKLQTEAAVARQAQALARYKHTVLAAFEEVENALNGVSYLKISEEQARDALQSADRRSQQKQDQFTQGLLGEDYLLQVQDSYLLAQDNLVTIKTSLQNQWVALARATATPR